MCVNARPICAKFALIGANFAKATSSNVALGFHKIPSKHKKLEGIQCEIKQQQKEPNKR